jgi:hypothetical protein
MDLRSLRLADAPVRQSHRYLENRKECLDYPGALALGLPIGSGMIESGHRHVLHGRLKKAGAAWLPDHADQLANLRVLRANVFRFDARTRVRPGDPLAPLLGKGILALYSDREAGDG